MPLEDVIDSPRGCQASMSREQQQCNLRCAPFLLARKITSQGVVFQSVSLQVFRCSLQQCSVGNQEFPRCFARSETFADHREMGQATGRNPRGAPLSPSRQLRHFRHRGPFGSSPPTHPPRSRGFRKPRCRPESGSPAPPGAAWDHNRPGRPDTRGRHRILPGRRSTLRDWREYQK